MTKNIKILFYVSIFLLIFKIIAIYYSQLGLHGDEAQYWSWSKNIAGGYFSKPPLLPILVRSFSVIFGDSVFSIKLVSVILYLLSSLSIYFLATKLYDKNIGLISGLSFFLLPGVSFSSFIVSTDVPLIIFWALSLYFLLCFLEQPKIYFSTILGICLCLGFLSKYAMIYFFICTIVYLILNKETRKIIIGNKKYCLLILCVFLIGIMPNIYWNFNNNWLTLDHTYKNISLEFSGLKLNKFLEFSVAQFFIVGPVFFITILFYFKKIFFLSKQNLFLICFSFPILILVTLESLLVRAHGNWAALSYICITIIFVANLYKINPKLIMLSNAVNLILGILFFFLILINSNLKIFDQLRGYENFSKQIVAYTNNEKIDDIVIDERMMFALINYYTKDTDFNLYIPKNPNSKITNHFQISNSLPKEFNKSFIYIGSPSQINYLIKNYKIILLEQYKVNSDKNNVEIYKFIKN